ncbi:Outer membrane assembly protein [uncultured Paludibacter sp.]|nr:Outer membrane assembly protein [uncultured Paludibacter sp.]
MATKKGKKALIIVFSIILFVFAALAVIPFAFQGKIMEIAKKELNKQLNANVDFNKLNVSLFRNFPDASLSLKDLKIIGTGDFSKDTLLYGKDINLVVNLKSLFSDTGYDVKKLEFNDVDVFAHVLKDGRANWDIVKTDSTAKKDTTASTFKMMLKDFKIKNSNIVYIDEQSDMTVRLKTLNHHLSGDFTADSTTLITQTSIDSLDYWSNGMKYASKLKVNVLADIKADFNKKLYTLANNIMNINAIPLSVNGWVQMLDDGYNMDLKLNSEKVDFKSILSLIPAVYAKSFEDIKADGKVDLNGFLKGKMTDSIYPAFDLNLDVKDAWFQYPNLPKPVQKINIASRITNPGGSLDATVVDVPTFSFNMGGNPFSGSLHVITPVSDLDFALKAIGKIDLGMIKNVYPLEKGTEMNGLLDMNVDAAGKMSYVDKNQYENFKFSGVVNVKNILLKMKEMTQDVSVSNANLQFNNRFLNLTNLMMKIGQNDLSADGKVENYLAYALRDKTLKGDFNFNSNLMNLNDFMSSDKNEKDTSSLQVIKLPKNLDLALTGNIKKLIYDKMNFSNATASMKLADGDLKINTLSTDGFGGKMGLTGTYSTSNPSKPAVDLALNLTDISFSEIFSQVDMLKKFAPIFDQAAGKFSSKLSLNTLLQDNMMPVLASVLGNGSLNTNSVAIKEVTAFSQLANSLKLNNVSDMVLKDISLMFEIKDGKVNTKPFNLKWGDVQMNLGGSTGLDQTIDYAGKVKLPDKLNLGKFQNIGFKIGGTFTKPKIELDLASTVQSIVEEKKTEVLSKVEAAKTQVTEQVNAKREQALKEAQAKADKILENAKLAGNKLVEQAQMRGDSLVAKATNPVTKALAKKGSDELVKQAQKQADKLYNDAQAEANKLIKEASESTQLK